MFTINNTNKRYVFTIIKPINKTRSLTLAGRVFSRFLYWYPITSWGWVPTELGRCCGIPLYNLGAKCTILLFKTTVSLDDLALTATNQVTICLKQHSRYITHTVWLHIVTAILIVGQRNVPDLRTMSGWPSLPWGGRGRGTSPLSGRRGRRQGWGESGAWGLLCCWPLVHDWTACPQHPLTWLRFGRPFNGDSVFEEKDLAEMQCFIWFNNTTTTTNNNNIKK